MTWLVLALAAAAWLVIARSRIERRRLRRQLARIRSLAPVDWQTGLLAPMVLEQRVAGEIKRSQRAGASMAVLLWRGDGVAMLGQQLREALLPGEAGFRVEHDEVLAVQSMASDVSVRELLSRLAQQDDASTAVEARPAVAWYPHDGASAAELLAVVRARAAHAATTVAA